MGKKPRAEKRPQPAKRPSTGAVDPDTDGKLSWRFGEVDLDGRWGWRTFDREHASDLHVYLASAEQDEMHALLRGGKVKAIPVAHICREAQQRLVEIGAEEHDTLWEFRVPTRAKWRAWGLVRGRVFCLLWWDPEHTVCPTGPPRGTRRR